MADGKSQKKAISVLKRKAAAYIYSACSYGPGHPDYPATRAQFQLIHAYAEKNNIDVLEVYSDEGKSRNNLKRMIADVHSGTAKYDLILLRDITRWGRSFNSDESAHYEFVCRKAGIDVHYVDEPFKNDESVSSSIFRSIKRVVEKEYRREVALKAAAARARRKKKSKNRKGK